MPSPSSPTAAVAVQPAAFTNIDALVGTHRWASNVATNLSFSFPYLNGTNATFSAANGVGNYSSIGEPSASSLLALSTVQQAAVRTALQQWSNVANISFTEIAETATNVGDMRFALTSAVNLVPGTTTNAWGWGYAPSASTTSAGDVWLSTTTTSTDWSAGSYNFGGLLHEIGHTLGLKHPFDEGVKLPTGLDSKLYTVMSYADAANNVYPLAGTVNGVLGWVYSLVNPETPMVLDIAAMQHLYGANQTYKSGNDVYTFENNLPFFKTLWDAGGIDTLSASNFTLPCTIDLTPGRYSSLRILPSTNLGGQVATYDGTNNLGIAFGAVIENAIGGSANDTLIGNSANNALTGGAGKRRIGRRRWH